MEELTAILLGARTMPVESTPPCYGEPDLRLKKSNKFGDLGVRPYLASADAGAASGDSSGHGAALPRG